MTYAARSQRGATASEAIRDRLDRIYEDYYNFIPEDRDDIVPAREDGDDSAPARKLVPQSVTIGNIFVMPRTCCTDASN